MDTAGRLKLLPVCKVLLHLCLFAAQLSRKQLLPPDRSITAHGSFTSWELGVENKAGGRSQEGGSWARPG